MAYMHELLVVVAEVCKGPDEGGNSACSVLSHPGSDQPLSKELQGIMEHRLAVCRRPGQRPQCVHGLLWLQSMLDLQAHSQHRFQELQTCHVEMSWKGQQHS